MANKYTAQDVGRILATYRIVHSTRVTARLTGSSRMSVNNMVNGKLAKNINPEEARQEADIAAKRIGDKFEQIADKMLDYANANINRIKSPKDAVLAAAIATDKMQLLRGGATQRIESSPLAVILGIIAPKQLPVIEA